MPSWTEWVRERLDAPDDVIEEVAQQLEDAFEDALSTGASETEARARAFSQVPDWSSFAHTVRLSRVPPYDPVRRRVFASGLWQDVRYGVRGLVGNPSFTLLASVALALGIGANTVTFSFVHSLLFQELPVHEPERLVRIYGSLPDSFDYATVSFPELSDLRSMSGLFSDVFVEKFVPLNWGGDHGGERIWAFMSSGRLFSTLGIAPAHGRFFDYEDDGATGRFPEAVLSYGFWQSAYGARMEVLGTTMSINGQPFEIVGVAPERFTGTGIGVAPAAWLPASMSEVIMPGFVLDDRRNRSFLAMARLRPGVDIASARAGLDVLAKRLQTEFPDTNRGVGFNLLPEAAGGIHPIMRGGFVGFSGVLGVVVVLVLLLACANVAGLLLFRAARRRREIAVRLALGATRGTLIRQFLVESLLLSSIAGAIGMTGAWWCAYALRGIGPPIDLPLALPMTLDLRVLGFAVSVSLLTGLLFGLAPALETSRSDLVPSLKASLGGWTKRRSRLRFALVAGQVALSTTLFVGAGLFVRGLSNGRDADLGFVADGLLIASLDLSLHGYSGEEATDFFDDLGARVAALRGVESSAWANMIPFDIDINQNNVAPEGFEPTSSSGTPSINRNVVSRDYFDTMRIRIVAGRGFEATDHAESPPVVVVNETLAARFWPGESPVGKRMGRPGGTMMEVVGVVEDGKYLTLGEAPTPFFFFPLEQRPTRDMTLVVRAAEPPYSLVEPIRTEARKLAPGLPLYDVKPMSEHLQIALAPARAGVSLLGFFSLLALALAALGLYGVLAFSVAEQRFEIGLRRALGAEARDILKSVLGRGLRLTVAGLAVGLVASVGLGWLAASVLYGVDPVDPLVSLAAVLVLLATALAASYVPAQRAIEVDPVTALRSD